jgi:putative membrane protein
MMGIVTSGDYFSPAEKEQIRCAVVTAEAETSGEIVPMVVDRSDSYREAEELGGVLMAGLIAFGCLLVSQHSSIWTYIPLVFLFFLPSRALLRKFPVLKLPLIGRERIDEAVRERAVRAFYDNGLYRTKDETGVLIFISMLERKVWILADRGIYRKLPHEHWQTLASEVSAGIRDGRACSALCGAIAGCGSILSEHFPKNDVDLNELPDDLIMEG